MDKSILLLKSLGILGAIFYVLVGCSGGGGGGGDTPPGNTAPVVTAGCATTSQANAVMGTLMATDTDPISYSLDINNPMVANGTSVNGGTVTLNTVTGDFTYTPPAAGPRGRDTFQFRVDDPTSFSIGTETVIVNPNIMPLGDSITLGTGNIMVTPRADAVSYRLQLLNRLNADGYQFDYVGELTSGDNILPAGQRAHAGYGGCQDQHFVNGNCNILPDGVFLDGIFNELEANPADIVLVHVGTNNVNNVQTDPSDMEAILNEIGRWEDSANGNPVSVLVMQIINQCISVPTGCLMGGGAQEANIIQFNANVIDRIMNPMSGLALPDQVIFGAELDMFNALGGTTPDPMLFEDDFHPNLAGYNIIGDILFNSLTGANAPAILQRCP